MTDTANPPHQPQAPPEPQAAGPPPYGWVPPPPANTSPQSWPPYAGQGYPYPPQGQPYYMPPANAPQQQPAVWPVVVFTVLFGAFGAISAFRRSRTARTLGRSGRRYWGAFVATLAAAVLVWTSLGVVAASRTTPPPVMTTAQLQSDLTNSGDFVNSLGYTATPTSATCVQNQVAANGSGTYRCIVDFSTGGRVSYLVTVDGTGAFITSTG